MLELIATIASFFLALAIYFLPYIAARMNRHKNYSAIAALNLLLGWTVVGWILALVWSQTDNREPKV
jgi:ABC-type molybdate transport system permease subunit